MSHLEFAAYESTQLAETSWERWMIKAERIAGHDLDGDETTGDTYSIDGAYDAFRAGETPEQYVVRTGCAGLHAPAVRLIAGGAA